MDERDFLNAVTENFKDYTHPQSHFLHLDANRISPYENLLYVLFLVKKGEREKALLLLNQILKEQETEGEEKGNFPIALFEEKKRFDRNLCLQILPVLVDLSKKIEEPSLEKAIQSLLAYAKTNINEKASPKIALKLALIENRLQDTELNKIALYDTEFLGELLSASFFMEHQKEKLASLSSSFWDKDFQVFIGPSFMENSVQTLDKPNFFYFFNSRDGEAILKSASLVDQLLSAILFSSLDCKTLPIPSFNQAKVIKEDDFLAIWYIEEKPQESLWKKAHPLKIIFNKNLKSSLVLQGRGLKILNFEKIGKKLKFLVHLSPLFISEIPSSPEELFSIFLSRNNSRLKAPSGTIFELNKPLLFPESNLALKLELNEKAVGHIQTGKRFSEITEERGDWQIFFRPIAEFSKNELLLTINYQT
ncbi:hypothetical protein [Criblamydia sequanensis]|uniref:Uncharacterized protein n=1 Tax=Candidatus Criblamydia sequanensis CRIB-18 TaxID=1437425 RepID=A0A090DY77_9BACT|nr:hypothetical protein [Criblamydia sequanensis]CDR33694.1 hypothetical protein CSEC_0866 [Criblamydia sequanensis CRIB-18]